MQLSPGEQGGTADARMPAGPGRDPGAGKFEAEVLNTREVTGLQADG